MAFRLSPDSVQLVVPEDLNEETRSQRTGRLNFHRAVLVWGSRRERQRSRPRLQRAARNYLSVLDVQRWQSHVLAPCSLHIPEKFRRSRCRSARIGWQWIGNGNRDRIQQPCRQAWICSCLSGRLVRVERWTNELGLFLQ